jgi:hypothetical protein
VRALIALAVALKESINGAAGNAPVEVFVDTHHPASLETPPMAPPEVLRRAASENASKDPKLRHRRTSRDLR